MGPIRIKYESFVNTECDDFKRNSEFETKINFIHNLLEIAKRYFAEWINVEQVR
mgnify:CR=1 FL=1